MLQNALGQSDCKMFKSTIFLEQNNKIACFSHVGKSSWILQVGWKIFGWMFGKIGMNFSVTGL